MGVFDSDQFHSASIDITKLCGTVLCEEEGRSPFLKKLRPPWAALFFADSALRVQLGLIRPDPKKSSARFNFAGMTIMNFDHRS
jgi:hypothetical protein